MIAIENTPLPKLAPIFITRSRFLTTHLVLLHNFLALGDFNLMRTTITRRHRKAITKLEE